MSQTLLRVPASRGLRSANPVDRKARVIRDVRVITRGEAKGHGYWVDSTMLAQVAELGNATEGGVRSRWTHPGLFSDGLGTFLGRVRNFRVEGDSVLGDLYLSQVASKAPHGDLAEYTMLLAEEDASAFGLSIAFQPDPAAEDLFRLEHSATGMFDSPDPQNTSRLPHWRVASLLAVDLVEDPAANPAGLLSALQRPHGREENMAVETKAVPTATVELERLAAENAKMQVELDALRSTAAEREKQELASTIEQLQAHAAKIGPDEILQRHIKRVEKLWSIDRAEAKSLAQDILDGGKRVVLGATPAPVPTEQGDFMAEVQALALAKRIPVTAAISQLMKEKPELHEAWTRSMRPVRKVGG